MLTPFERYQNAIASGEYFPDTAQTAVIEQLQLLYHQLQTQATGIQTWLRKKTPAPQGLYLWGSVGVGKTWLMDLFFSSLPSKQKQRRHFHEFMLDIHDQLQRFQGTTNPLEKIAKQFARHTKLLCFDEFFVEDIADAMILARLFEALFKEKIIIVVTSNVPPEGLYQNGLQRSRFLPVISLIKKQMRVIHLQTRCDYRLRELEQAGVFFSPLTKDNQQRIEKLFSQLAHGEVRHHRDVYLYDRPIKTFAYADNIIWFDFNYLCHVPRSQVDYLSIAKRWPIVIISNIQPITIKETNTARLFINLIDVFYDLHITLIMLSAVAINDLYVDGELQFAFQRTRSRLIEMQSSAYLSHAEKKRRHG